MSYHEPNLDAPDTRSLPSLICVKFPGKVGSPHKALARFGGIKAIFNASKAALAKGESMIDHSFLTLDIGGQIKMETRNSNEGVYRIRTYRHKASGRRRQELEPVGRIAVAFEPEAMADFKFFPEVELEKGTPSFNPHPSKVIRRLGDTVS